MTEGCVLLRSAGGEEGGESDDRRRSSKVDVDNDMRVSGMT